MNALFSFFWQLFLLRKAPQDLPTSSVLLVLLLLTNLFVGATNAAPLFASLEQSVYANLVDTGLAGLMLYLPLALGGRAARWQQAFTAFLGIEVLSGLLMMVYQTIGSLLQIPELVGILNLIMVVWIPVVYGNIVRHTFELPMLFSILIVFFYTMFAFAVMNHLFQINVQ